MKVKPQSMKTDEWIAEERRLWDLLMHPKMAYQHGWKIYEEWINH